MNASNYDVIVVGAGSAGLTAAIGLAQGGLSVLVLEAAEYPGAENWSGCVYFCENLADPSILGDQGVAALAWERQLVERGFFVSDGQGLLGMKYRDPQAFRHCYTVLRPIFDHHLAEVASRLGVAILTNTTAESLIRDAGRIVGVSTNRGAVYASLVFLAEGDASHLVTREGYERYADQREAPRFLQGLKQVIELPPGAIEEIFGVAPEEGVAYEVLLRNGTLKGKAVRLNMGGFVYTNRQSLSVGLVLPVENLREGFAGDPNLLMEWFINLPALRPWLGEGKPGVFGAKIIRGGGARDIPTLIDDGLAVGGAASAIGIDFPYPNFTGPATAMGLLIAQAAKQIRTDGKEFTKENLQQYYLQPLRRTHYFQDVEFLRAWPGYVKRTQFFFDRNLDLALGSAYVWTRPKRWFATKWLNWLRLIGQVAGPGQWREMRADWKALAKALRLREVMSRPKLGRLLLDGTINSMRDLAGSPRANLPQAGTFTLLYTVAGEDTQAGLPPLIFRRWFGRMARVLASAARGVYCNDDLPLAAKLPAAIELMVRQVNMFDLVGFGCLALLAGVNGIVLTAWDRLVRFLTGQKKRAPRGLYPRYAQLARLASDMTATSQTAAQSWDSRLGLLGYQTVKASHIHLLWPKALAGKNGIADKGLWHVCPARVYEARQNDFGQLQLVVNHENCIKCETCWRASDLVDWGRDGRQRFSYTVGSPVVPRLLETVHAPGGQRTHPPLTNDSWAPLVGTLGTLLQAEQSPPQNGQDASELGEMFALVEKLDKKLLEFDNSLAREPRNVDRPRAEYLEMLARYAQQLAARLLEILRQSTLADSPRAGLHACYQHLLSMATSLLAMTEVRARRTWDQRFAWAAADGRQVRYHHLAGLRRLLDELSRQLAAPVPETDLTKVWLSAESCAEVENACLVEWRRQLDSIFGPAAWRGIDSGAPLTTGQDAVLRDLVAQVPLFDPSNPHATIHPPVRKALLAELGRRDPSLAYRVASHLWARDLASLRPTSPELTELAGRWARGDEWACFADVEGVRAPDGGWRGEVWFVPALHANSLLLLLPNHLAGVSVTTAGLRREAIGSLGLRGAGLCRVHLEDIETPGVGADQERLRRVWHVLSAADLTSVARGMADQLYRRAVDHARTRVQFPGLFHDLEARDTIGKFGAVKKMVAEMASHRYLLETLDAAMAPADFSAATVERASLTKAIAAEALGTLPGSLAYNAGQIFGGTGYSEDDSLSKYYRDASAWRFLGPTNREIYCRHGERLLRGWHADGRRLASFPHEAQLFEQVVQRKALQAELDEIRVLRARLRGLVNDWMEVQGSGQGDKTPTVAPMPFGAELTETLARHDSALLAAKALLLRTHARMEHGHDSEVESSLLRVFLDDASWRLEVFETEVHRRLGGRIPGDDRPLIDISAGPGVASYRELLASPCPYVSGDFLLSPVDVSLPRLVPELVEADPELTKRERGIRQLLSEHFGRPRDGGLSYERYMERRHRPDEADLEFCRRQGFFRMTIPQELGGLGKQKIDYYQLTMNAQRLADVGISLCIQVNTSIGTSPITLARDDDLPRAYEDMSKFAADPALQRDIQTRLERLLRLAETSGPRRVEEAFNQLRDRIDKSVLRRSAARTLAFRFSAAWQEAQAAKRAFDLARMQSCLRNALASWREACARAAEMQDELARRREACDLGLRWIASGQISAFALTEPSAGSDTARVATRAQLRSVPVETDADGVLHFVPEGGSESRSLLDARRLDFRPDGVYYAFSDHESAAPIHFEEYDYETDDPRCGRYYDHGARRVHFSDIAQLRERAGRLWYDYWELTGSKMWITNGRMAGLFCLYAKTEEGVTGFIVDRHAEGLVVGKDEAKMGQLGSPTNELSLQAVRVPRENVLGLEGRGQVNALESLNVGRAGLATSAAAQMAGIIDHARSFLQANYADMPDWAGWRLAHMEEIRFISEAIAYEIVGRFDHPQTQTVRMESAIAKMLTSELLHELIELAEVLYDLAGQADAHLLEKRKRDARILCIYEGTNEVQRFLLLKDLVTEVAPRQTLGKTKPLPGYLGPGAVELEALRAELWKRILAASEVFGQELWQNPDLQANCFLLSEAVAWFKAADSTLGRIAWLARQAMSDENTEPAGIDIGRRALDRCMAEVNHRLRRFEEELIHLRRGHYALEVRAASLLFRTAAPPLCARPPANSISSPLSVLVVVCPSAATAPQPQVAGGNLLGAHFSLTEADRSALEVALRLRDGATAKVSIQVASVGPRGCASALREALSLGVDRARLVLAESDAIAADSAARALAAILGEGTSIDLVLGGETDLHEEGLLTRLVGKCVQLPLAGSASQLAVRKGPDDSSVVLLDEDGRPERTRSLPAVISVRAGTPLRAFNLEGYLANLSRAVDIERWPRRVEFHPVSFLPKVESPAAMAKDTSQVITASEAAKFALTELALRSGETDLVVSFSGELADVSWPSLRQGGVLAMVAAGAEGELQATADLVLRMAGTLAGRENLPLDVFLMMSGDEAAQRRAIGRVVHLSEANIILSVADHAGKRPDLTSMVLRETYSDLGVEPRALVGEPWCEDAFAALGLRSGTENELALRVCGLEACQANVYLETSRAGGKLRAHRMFKSEPGTTWWITISPDARIDPGAEQVPVRDGARQSTARVQRWAPRLDRFYGQGSIRLLLEELKEEITPARLSDADFIIDVGFGIRNGDGLEEVIGPLANTLRTLGVRNLAIGGSRKVTEELHLLSPDKQIGQSGVAVNPRILLAIGISGAPQHLNYLGGRATIIAFNHDPEAPIMILNRRQLRPRVLPVVGDLFETVPAFTRALKQDAHPDAIASPLGLDSPVSS
jgi:electron transfer flavoprotein-quinone oxidoreductase